MNLRKKGSSQRGFANRTNRNPLIQFSGILSYIVLLAMRVPLSKVIDDAGIGLFAPAFELFFLITLFTSYGMTAAVSGSIRYRVKREQYRNAKQIFHGAVFMNLFFSAVLAAVLVFMSSFIADIVVLESLCRMAVIAVAPALVFAALIGVLRGYFNGYGMGTVTVHSQYLEVVTMAVGMLFASKSFHAYGLKVAALKQIVAYSYSYGAFGAMLGVALSQFITTIYLVIIFLISSDRLRHRTGTDTSKRVETKISIQQTLLVNSIPISVVAVLSNLFLLIDQRFFNYCMNKREMGGVRTKLWGSFYDKFVVLTGIGAALGVLSVYGATGRIGASYDRGDYRMMRERLEKAVRRLCMIVFPLTVYLAALAQAVMNSLYKGKNDTVVLWVRKGSVLIALYGFCFLFGQLLYRLRMLKELFLSTLISVFVHILTAYLLVQRAFLGADGIIYSLIVFLALYGALNFFFVSRNLKYRQDWIRDVAFPGAAAGVSGVVVMLLERFLLEPVGGPLTILIGIVSGLFLYITFLMILRVIGEEELSRIPLGFFFIMLGKNLGIL